jgi:hypothetical protein
MSLQQLADMFSVARCWFSLPKEKKWSRSNVGTTRPLTLLLMLLLVVVFLLLLLLLFFTKKK